MEFLGGKNEAGISNAFLDGPLPFIHTGLTVIMIFFMGLQMTQYFAHLLHFTPILTWICMVLPLLYLPDNQKTQGETTLYVSLLILHL
jgi:hypothetical protein